MFEVIFLPDAERAFKRLDKSVQRRIAAKIDWIQAHADEMVHHPLSSPPEDLKGLCRIRVGDYRILYWVYSEGKRIKIYSIGHRSGVYGQMK